MNKKSIGVIVIVLLALILWAPWITQNYAEQKVSQNFLASQQEIVDGCGFNCDGCGVRSSQKKLFGYSVTIGYACGFSLSESAVPDHVSMVFVSFIGTMHQTSLAIGGG